ncbi:peptide chain release factor N(5)-glutamine methyltransferase [Pseudomonas sp. gcc21]|uniref:peptide chain release factor N(5)-glutamine methyltransferase n=1 Tax=Pseudomonas sp. gcc21 TaxID=2726989 RepID=UPI00145242F6|nr:peptide chain release factor N(5)-glutamine methyltransferase [Pseudomonas sp. gcc21]QJD60314.1 peptide chain release factor N(5)-glutamine methyltransferase [Pseudomonas sp. gcc21]
MSLDLASLLHAAALPDSDSPRLDAELLLAHALNKPRSFLLTWPEHQPQPEQVERFQHLLQRRRAGEPVAYLLGQRGFWSLDLEVDSSTLIPRPDTERLVEVALERRVKQPARVLDLGTGTGAVALALAVERPAWNVTGCDSSASAVALSERNRQRLGISNAVFLLSDWFAGLAQSEAFDLIVSNPPYIAENDPHLAEGDVRFEPASALVSGPDGLGDIRHIVHAAPGYLQSTGWLLLEHGWEQAGAVRELLVARGFVEVQSWQDLAGHQRVSGGRWHE